MHIFTKVCTKVRRYNVVRTTEVPSVLSYFRTRILFRTSTTIIVGPTVRILFSYEDRHFRKYPRRIVGLDRYVIPSYESKLYNDVPSYCTTTDFFPELFYTCTVPCTKVFFRVLVEAT